MTFVTVEGHQLAADQADRFLAALLAPRYARVCRATLNPEDGPGLAAFDAAGVPVFFYPLDPGHVACAAQAGDGLEEFLAACL